VPKVICHKAPRRVDGWFNVIRQVTSTCPPMRAHWRHLVNAIEPVHPSAHSSPQPKRQTDRFSRFCTANGTKCLYLTMGALIHQKCPFPLGIWTSHVTHDALGPCEPTTETAPLSVQPCLHRCYVITSRHRASRDCDLWRQSEYCCTCESKCTVQHPSGPSQSGRLTESVGTTHTSIC